MNRRRPGQMTPMVAQGLSIFRMSEAPSTSGHRDAMVFTTVVRATAEIHCSWCLAPCLRPSVCDAWGRAERGKRNNRNTLHVRRTAYVSSHPVRDDVVA